MIASIISEYNPFHNGHKYQIQKAREKGASHIVSIMSGNVVQRGDTAIYSKHYRARQALLGGADLVIELPTPFCISSAEGFAKNGVYIADAIGSDSLCFGCECDDSELLYKASEFSSKLSDFGNSRESEVLKGFLKEGNSYPLALFKTAETIYNKQIAEIFKGPNNVLAIEYLKALNNTNMKPMPVLRKGPYHDDNTLYGDFACASKIRELLKSGFIDERLLPYKADFDTIRDIKNMERGILFSLNKMSREELIKVPDCNKDIADRIIKALRISKSYDELIFNIKTKAFTLARIRRVIMYAVLGIKSSDFELVPYARILAFNDRGAEILSKAKWLSKIDISTSLKELELKSENNKRLAQLDVITGNFALMCQKSLSDLPNEYSVKIQKTNTK